MSKSNIEWTEFTWNPVTGCDKVSAGCKNCYAETIAYRFWDDRRFTDVKCHPERMLQPLKMKKSKMIFVNSMSDLFHAKINPAFLRDIIQTMQVARWHTFQVLTKRPRYMRDFIEREKLTINKNVWLGVSVENQATANERIPLLLETPAQIHWLSIEPLLEDINLDIAQLFDNKMRGRHIIDWVVVGCESGPKRRECKIEWVSNIVYQCQQEKIPVFVKQLQLDGKVVKDINQFPKHLQIREYPNE